MTKVLVSDKLAQEGIDIVKRTAEVDVNTGLSEDELCAIIGSYDGLIIRSATKVTAKVLESAGNLKMIARAGVGVDNVDVPLATERGIVVVNSPGGNTIAAAELSVAMMLALSRNIPQAYLTMKNSEWNRSKYVGNEVYKKKIAILGLGKIGQEVAKRCTSFGMEIIAYDPFITHDVVEKLGVTLADLDECFKQADYISLHLPKNKETLGMISDAQFDMMKDGVRIVNCARGGIIDDEALVKAIKSGKCAGAALDVYVNEPPDFSHELFSLDNVVTTPHLGASTEEAQVNVAIDVAEQMADYFEGKPVRSAVNMPAMAPEVLSAVQPYLPLAEKIASLAIQTMEGRPCQIDLKYAGELSEIETGPISRAVLVGLMKPSMGEQVNSVNAPTLAKSRGIEIVETKTADSDHYNTLLTVNVKTDKQDMEISGTLFSAQDMKIVKMGEFPMDLEPEGVVLVAPHTDKPGIIGQVGTLLGKAGINIASMYVGRKKQGEQAIMALNVDAEVPSDIVEAIGKIEGIDSVNAVTL